MAIFFVQTWLVYSDSTGRATEPLSPTAQRGREVWHENNCQVCHQIFGFGGFLGPDLTNAAKRLTQAQVDLLLKEGSGQMPSFDIGVEDRRALLQFLTEVDRTGLSQPRARVSRPADELLDETVAAALEREDPLTAPEEAGLGVLRREKCLSCHLPNFDSRVRAPDLVTALSRVGEERILKVLQEGVPGKVMPQFALAPEERAGVIAFLRWLEARQDRFYRAFEVTRPDAGGSLFSLPWFEYE